MSKVCEICGKGPTVGNQIVRRGKAKRKGGIGQNVTGITKRRWLPNLQRVRVVVNGTHKRMRMCVSCLKAMKVTKGG